MRTGDPASPSGHAADPSVWGGFSSVEVRPSTSWREGVDIGCIQLCPPERIFLFVPSPGRDPCPVSRFSCPIVSGGPQQTVQEPQGLGWRTFHLGVRSRDRELLSLGSRTWQGGDMSTWVLLLGAPFSHTVRAV